MKTRLAVTVTKILAVALIFSVFVQFALSILVYVEAGWYETLGRTSQYVFFVHGAGDLLLRAAVAVGLILIARMAEQVERNWPDREK